MAEGKNSFILYKDLIHTVKKLPKEKQADLFLTILEYVNDLEPEIDDPIIDLVFEPVKQGLKRDLVKWNEKKQNRSEAGKVGGLKSGESRKSKQTKQTKRLLHAEANEANEAVSVSGIVSGSVIKQQADAQDLSDKVDKFLSNQRRNEAFCMQNHITMGDLSNIQKQFIREVDVDKINDLWSYFRTVYTQGKYDGFIKKMVM